MAEVQTEETNIRQAKSTAQDLQKTGSPKKLKLNSPAPKKKKKIKETKTNIRQATKRGTGRMT